MASTKSNWLNNAKTLRQTIEQLMHLDNDIFLWGRDIGLSGGEFNVTEGLQDIFGEYRVWDTPISEETVLGMGVGISIYGKRPIIEMKTSSDTLSGLTQIISHASRMRNRTRGKCEVPMVIRIPIGSSDVNSFEHQSEAYESLFAKIPGLQVIMPSNPYDMKGLFVSAVRNNDPIIFFEDRRIYQSITDEIPNELYEVPIGKAKILRDGTTITVVSYGAMIHEVKKAIDLLKYMNPTIEVELIDLLTIKPFDIKTILSSIKKTGRLLVVHEENKSFSISSEIIASVMDNNGFVSLLAPPSRLASWDIVKPLSKGQKFNDVNPEIIANKIIDIVAFKY